MAKTTTKKSEEPKKSSGSKSASKGSSKAATKGATKGDKPEKKSRGKQNQSVAFLYGGELLKTNRQVLFSVEATKAEEIVQYVRDNFVKYYGSDVSGRFVKCEDADDTLVEVLEAAKEKDYLVEPDSNLLKCTVNDAAGLLKKVIDSETAHTFKLGEAKKDKASPKKGAKKAKDASDDSDGSDDEGSDEEKEPKKGKGSPKKGSKKAKDDSDDEEVDKDKSSDDSDDDKKEDSDEDKSESEPEPAAKKGKGKAAPKKTK